MMMRRASSREGTTMTARTSGQRNSLQSSILVSSPVQASPLPELFLTMFLLIVLVPPPQDLHKNDPHHPDYEREQRVEALIDWLRMVSLMDQLSEVNAAAIRAAIERTNFMVVNRVRASRCKTFHSNFRQWHFKRSKF